MDGTEFVVNGKEYRYHRGIELGSVPATDLLHRLLVREGFLVGSPGKDRVVHIRKGKDAGGKGDVLAGERGRISGSVEPLVMVHGEIPGHEELPAADLLTADDLLHGPCADHRVPLHLLELFRRERTRLQQDAVPDPDFPDIVKRGDPEELIDEMLFLSHPPGEDGRDMPGTLQVPPVS